jgi:ribose transport system substrate-binding protein
MTREHTIFVIMPFTATPCRTADQLTAYFDHHLKRRIERETSLRNRYRVHRSDDTFDITAGIIRDLQSADIVICDLSGPEANPNVMYELGVRLSITHKPVILVREKHPENKRIFDIAGFYAHEYDPLNYALLEEHVIAKLRGFEAGAEAFYSPVLDLLEDRSKRLRLVPLLLTAFLRQPFFAELLLEVTRLLDVRGARAVVMVPHSDYSTESQARQFASVLDHADAYEGAIVLPIDPDRERARIEDFVIRFGRPVVFVDTQLSFLDSLPRHVAFAGYDSVAGGTLAAAAAVAELRARQVSAPSIVVIGASVQRARQDNFHASVSLQIPEATFSHHDDAGFDREITRRLVQGELTHARRVGRTVDLIFCTNDEMALGARSAVLEAGTDSIVIGYDAVSEATNLIEAQDRVLRNSVRQDRQPLAQEAVKRLYDLLDGTSGSMRSAALLAPSLFKPVSTKELPLPISK